MNENIDQQMLITCLVCRVKLVWRWDGPGVIMVEPCLACLDAAYDNSCVGKVREQDYQDGRESGYNEGYDAGCLDSNMDKEPAVCQ